MTENICIVTGVANGIGKATFLRFLSNGYTCIGIDKDRSKMEAMREDIGEEGKRMYLITMDLLYDTALDNGIMKKLEQPNVHLTLVNNIGGSRNERQPFEDSTWEIFVKSMTFNLKPLHTLISLCLPIMKQNQSGKIVNISSISGRQALKNVGAEYAASKSAIIGLSRHLASELIEDNILVNTVCPGIIGTERMLQRWGSRDEQINQKVLEKIPVKRLGTPAEVANAIFFLGSESNTYITGAILDVNGGMYAP